MRNRSCQPAGQMPKTHPPVQMTPEEMRAFGLTPEPVKAYLDRVLAENMELKADIARLQTENMSLKALVQQLLARIEALENGSGKGSGRPPANSGNSSVPPSKDSVGFERGKDKKGKKGQKTSQKRKGHNGGNQRRLQPDTEKRYPPERCPYCGGTHFVDLQDGTPHQQVELKEIPLDCRITGEPGSPSSRG